MFEERRIKTWHTLLALALVVVGVAIGWATDGGGSRGGADSDASPGAGPTRTVDGIPVGYERSREGAVAAALTYGRVVGEPAFVTDRRRRGRILARIATDEFARRYERAGAGALAQLASTPLYRGLSQGERAIWTGAPLGYRVERYSEDEAVVFTWGVAVLGSTAANPQAVFSSSEGLLRWDGGDWKLAGGTDRVGPIPALPEGARPSSGSDFTGRLDRLQGLRYVP